MINLKLLTLELIRPYQLIMILIHYLAKVTINLLKELYLTWQETLHHSLKATSELT